VVTINAGSVIFWYLAGFSPQLVKQDSCHPILLFQQGLDDPSFNIWREKRDFSLLQNVQISSGTHEAYYSVGTESLSLEVTWSMLSRPPTSIWCQELHDPTNF
jgi:hypothetical protein